MTATENTTSQDRAVAAIQRDHVGCPTTTRHGRHGYVEVDVWTREAVKVYEIGPDGRKSRAA